MLQMIFFSVYLFQFQSYYYFAIIEDFILRFTWTITVSIGEGGMFHSEILKSILASLEVFRCVLFFKKSTVY